MARLFNFTQVALKNHTEIKKKTTRKTATCIFSQKKIPSAAETCNISVMGGWILKGFMLMKNKGYVI